MWDFEHGQPTPDFDIVYTVPSRCAADLAAGTADIGIIPAAAYTTIPDLMVLPKVAIASRRAVRSILLVSTVPVSQVRSVALDSSSLTSVALTRVLFSQYWKTQPAFFSMAPQIDSMLAQCDAALVIGDPALQLDSSKYFAYDLAEEWIRWTARPFVFAFWAVRKAALEAVDPALDLPAVFQQSRDHGLQPENLEQIARDWGPRMGLTADDVRSYLTENIFYSLDADCLEGLQLFYRLAHSCAALPAASPLQFLEAANSLLR